MLAIYLLLNLPDQMQVDSVGALLFLHWFQLQI